MSNLSPRALALQQAHGPGPVDWERVAEIVASCRNATLEEACGALAAVAIAHNRPECCLEQLPPNSPRECCGNPNLLVTAYAVASAIRRLTGCPTPNHPPAGRRSRSRAHDRPHPHPHHPGIIPDATNGAGSWECLPPSGGRESWLHRADRVIREMARREYAIVAIDDLGDVL